MSTSNAPRSWTTAEILAMPMAPGNDADAEDIRDYLTTLLGAVWRDREAFNGKRPFGNSGWQYEIYDALARAGVVDCPEGCEFTRQQLAEMDRLIDGVIGALGATSA